MNSEHLHTEAIPDSVGAGLLNLCESRSLACEKMVTASGVADLAFDWWGVRLKQKTASDIADLFTQGGQLKRVEKDRNDGFHICADGMFAWLKNRLMDAGLIGHAGCVCDDTQHASATLHVGFVFIGETTEMLARLREWQPAAEPSPTRSRFSKVSKTHAVRGVDAVARRVAGETQE